MTKRENWASPAELAAALKSGEAGVVRALAETKRKVKSAPPSAPRVIVTSKVIDAAWRSILEQTIPPETHPNLVKTYKRFFFAGAKALLDNFIYSDTLDESDEATATPGDVNRVDAVMHELNQFFGEVAAGRQ